MPRSKRRGPSSTNHNHTPIDMSVSGAHEDSLPRHPSKRLRHTSRFYFKRLFFVIRFLYTSQVKKKKKLMYKRDISITRISIYFYYSARRYTRTDDVSSVSTFSQKRCITWFREYTSPDDPDTLGPEGMEKFCEDIGVEPENVVMLVLAYKMNARQMGFFTLSEWLKGFSELQCDSISKIQQKLEYLRNQLNDHITFKGIYRYAYDFARVGTGKQMQ